MTHKDVLDCYIYGDLAHHKPKWRPKYVRIRDCNLFPLFQLEFAISLRVFSEFIRILKKINQEALHELESRRVDQA